MNSYEVFQNENVAELYDYWAECSIKYNMIAIELDLAMREFQLAHAVKGKKNKKGRIKDKGTSIASFNNDKIKELARRRAEAHIECNLASHAFERAKGALLLNPYNNAIKEEMEKLSEKIKEVRAKKESQDLADVLAMGN